MPLFLALFTIFVCFIGWNYNLLLTCLYYFQTIVGAILYQDFPYLIITWGGYSCPKHFFSKTMLFGSNWGQFWPILAISVTNIFTGNPARPGNNHCLLPGSNVDPNEKPDFRQEKWKILPCSIRHILFTISNSKYSRCQKLEILLSLRNTANKRILWRKTWLFFYIYSIKNEVWDLKK